MLTAHALSKDVEFERFKVLNKSVERSIHELESQESVGSQRLPREVAAITDSLSYLNLPRTCMI